MRALHSAVLNPPASLDQIASAADRQHLDLPGDYVSFLLEANGGTLSLGGTEVILYPVEQLGSWGDVSSDFPSHLRVFGENGGIERFAFDRRSKPHPIVLVPRYRPPTTRSFRGSLSTRS